LLPSIRFIAIEQFYRGRRGGTPKLKKMIDDPTPMRVTK
jgi:hypothetical protein